MQIKLLCVMYIKLLFLLSIVAHAEEETSNIFKIRPIRTDPLKTAIFKIQSNVDLCTHYKTIFNYNTLFKCLFP